MIPKRPLLLVTWLDHQGSSGWKDLPDLEELKAPEATTLGWLVHEDNERIVLCSSLVDESEWGSYDMIIKSCVTSRQEYELHE